jgi:hypothetical protein
VNFTKLAVVAVDDQDSSALRIDSGGGVDCGIDFSGSIIPISTSLRAGPRLNEEIDLKTRLFGVVGEDCRLFLANFLDDRMDLKLL